MAGSQISTSVTILNSLHGFMALSLTEYNTSAAASIAAGSVVEIAGAFFTFAGDEAINASSWTSIVTGTTAYITLTASGTAGSQIVDAAYTSTAPTWRDDFQGWYASAASNVRVIGTVYKAEATSYYPKFIYGPMQDGKQTSISVNSCSVASSISIGNSISSSSASASTSMTIAGNPVCSLYIGSSSTNIDYPVGTILTYNASGVTYLNTAVEPHIFDPAGTIGYYTTYVDNASTSTVLGTWVTRGRLDPTGAIYIIQRTV